jgi:glutamate/tyrosine decarboxylase-like PLP-dependent enzyme
MEEFDFSEHQREELWNFTIGLLEEYYRRTKSLDVAPELDIQAIQSRVAAFDFEKGLDGKQAVAHVISGLKDYHVHTPHPAYYGLFNPRASFPGILADLITAVINPQMAAWSHAPFATESENHCIRELGVKFGFERSSIDGTFCGGGAEANLTATLCALNHHFPMYANAGLGGIPQDPVMYCSAEAHHSVVRSARVTGIGLDSIRMIPCNEFQQMDTVKLIETIQKDVAEGKHPFMITANAGSTGTGAIDDLKKVGEIAKAHHLWFHVDGAYGGAVIVDDELKYLLNGIDESDSITIDIHKWFSVPMATSMFITKHKDILSQTFRITADYMPKEADQLAVTDPYTHSIQWSRRFIGLKFYLSLLMLGWEGLAKMIRSTTEVGELLKSKLTKAGWRVLNRTEMPIAVFDHPKHEQDEAFITSICKAVVSSGKAWVSIYNIQGKPALRACITNYATTDRELDELVVLLEELRTS